MKRARELMKPSGHQRTRIRVQGIKGDPGSVVGADTGSRYGFFKKTLIGFQGPRVSPNLVLSVPELSRRATEVSERPETPTDGHPTQNASGRKNFRWANVFSVGASARAALQQPSRTGLRQLPARPARQPIARAADLTFMTGRASA